MPTEEPLGVQDVLGDIKALTEALNGAKEVALRALTRARDRVSGLSRNSDWIRRVEDRAGNHSALDVDPGVESLRHQAVVADLAQNLNRLGWPSSDDPPPYPADVVLQDLDERLHKPRRRRQVGLKDLLDTVARSLTLLISKIRAAPGNAWQEHLRTAIKIMQSFAAVYAFLFSTQPELASWANASISAAAAVVAEISQHLDLHR